MDFLFMGPMGGAFSSDLALEADQESGKQPMANVFSCTLPAHAWISLACIRVCPLKASLDPVQLQNQRASYGKNVTRPMGSLGHERPPLQDVQNARPPCFLVAAVPTK
eukprot:363888-Chlamydomonas_euryale.AAC.10